MDKIANFLFEVGMLNRTPRTGYQFLGSGKESVAEHILRTLFVGYVLCKVDESLDEMRVLKMCLFHDLPEARTGDMNYVNKKYVDVNEEKAVQELTDDIFFGDDIKTAIDEFNKKETQEALVAMDADQIALILQLKEYGDLGNKYAEEWINYALQRLNTKSAKKLAEKILKTDFSNWWFKEKSDWWINGNKK
jgi:5'-deoxynucleotidase YfbR-like HD superfamily hydrolase